jgi:hypothetical protein
LFGRIKPHFFEESLCPEKPTSGLCLSYKIGKESNLQYRQYPKPITSRKSRTDCENVLSWKFHEKLSDPLTFREHFVYNKLTVNVAVY